MADEEGSDAKMERSGDPSEGLAPSTPRSGRGLGQSRRGDGRGRAMASKKIPEAEVAELLVAAGAALGRRAWREARELCEQALAGGERADALELLAVASWWQDDVDAAIAARERAYVLRREHGETVEAARVAGFLAWDYGAMRGSTRLPTAGCNGRVGLQGSWNPRPSMRRFRSSRRRFISTPTRMRYCG